MPYNNLSALFMYEVTPNINYMHYNDDHSKFPDLSYYVSLTVGTKTVVRYLHVRRRDLKKNDEIINMFDEVSISLVCKPNSIVYYLGSVTHELNLGNVVSYFLVRSVVDLKPAQGHWIEFKVKSFPVSKVRMSCS